MFQADERVYSSVMMAKRSSTVTCVSCSVMGGLGLAFGFGRIGSDLRTGVWAAVSIDDLAVVLDVSILCRAETGAGCFAAASTSSIKEGGGGRLKVSSAA